MARYRDALCKLCRREGTKVFLKGDRCFTDKCSFERRSYPPGQSGLGRGKVSEYAIQLREKQKVKRMYGLVETQFRNLFSRAERTRGVTGEHLVSLLERRFDNVVFRLGFASSRSEARMMVTHGFFSVNGRKVNIPSYTVEADEMVQLIYRIREIGITILLVEHDMGMVMEVSEEVVVLNSGQVIAEGTPRQVQNNEAVITAYLGERETENANYTKS